MRRRGRRLNQNSRSQRWFWIAGIGLGLVAVTGVLVLLNTSHRTVSKDRPPTGQSPSAVVPSSVTTSEAVFSVQSGTPLPPLDFPQGSVEEACGLNEFPPRVGYYDYKAEERRSWVNSPFNANGDWIALESEECTDALEAHINTINPYLWSDDPNLRQFAFVVLDQPLTFGRIFADPEGDLVRVQNALSRSECKLKSGTQVNWKLKEECHADAFMNYALINRFCFNEGIDNRDRTYYSEEDSPTTEQDRSMWKEDLENAWVRQKCEGLEPTLELTEHQPKLYELIMSLGDPEKYRLWMSDRLLIDHAARLGDDAAGLTQMPRSYLEEGYKFGRFNKFLSSLPWKELRRKEEPSPDRILRTFFVLGILERDQINFDWNWLADHLCSPPYEKQNTRKLEEDEVAEKLAKPKSCRVVIDELYTREDLPVPMLGFVDRLVQTAMELNVYD